LKFGYLRAAVYAAVVLGTAVALTFIPRLPENHPAEVLFSQAAVPAGKLQYDTLHARESLARVLKRGGLSDSAAIRAIQASSGVLDERRIPAGMQIAVKSESPDSAPSEVVLKLAEDRIVKLTRVGDEWTGKEEKLEWTIDTIAVAGTIQSNLYNAVDEVASDFLPTGARRQLTNAIAENVYNYKIDMTRELQKGDEFKAIAVRASLPGGSVRITDVIAASFTLSGSVMQAIHFDSKTGGNYFDEKGNSLKAMFSKYPVHFSRISSTFGSRRHPILGYTRAHKGTDYAASEGTTVNSVGDGVVTRSEWSSGYGNLIEIRHPNGYVTRYGHLSRRLVHAGERVKIDQEIGRVGHTGLATGPHLHFEVLINGEQRNSLTAFKGSSGLPIAKTEADTFAHLRDALLAKLNAIGRNTATTLAAVQSTSHSAVPAPH
jgi:murein DD-endopeptidase MepM/ murein hydrolase activator NlpD